MKPKRPAAKRLTGTLPESAKYLPCPICNGVEGCDHSVPERRRASMSEQKPAQDVVEEAKVWADDIEALDTSGETLSVRLMAGYHHLRSLIAECERLRQAQGEPVEWRVKGKAWRCGP